ncbi:TetR/AcrR family transcriptional regulator [Rhodococcus sp. (in: high G+C Gram-positive bacteria)]|uniref:TetR/AcrR family transcriptional regulator n=1 Tax=Rhodococcus sp. TaxID=1831 RepID=UPI0025803E30|nr:TetR/AcrR family transcriptional regulator [Rhodococcus sp. (in: high G+C Gram-positive bacteria)]MBQ7803105.1 TetR/AcrR family transcriptional regulator [Rhodococcus sp. (in: high G+C Gram-positive bacteria)]
MSGARSSRLLERRYEDVRLAVALAARDLFLECHSTAVTVESIAQRAEVSERTFYRHFTSKADLVSPLFERSNRSLIYSLRESGPGTCGIIDALVELFTREVAAGPTEYAELFELLMATPEYRLRWESADPDLIGAITEWLLKWSVHPEDYFTRRVTALTILTASQASYMEWTESGRSAGISGLRALHTKTFRALARPWLPGETDHINFGRP